MSLLKERNTNAKPIVTQAIQKVLLPNQTIWKIKSNLIDRDKLFFYN